jgi:hypothetical protein
MPSAGQQTISVLGTGSWSPLSPTLKYAASWYVWAERVASHHWTPGIASPPTADPKELDCDVLIAAQALDYQTTHGLASGELVMATVNIGHHSQFLAADLWQNITP